MTKDSREPGPVALGLVLVTVFLDLIGFGIVLPLLPFYATSMGATPLEVGFIMAAYSLMQLIFSPVWGSLSDKYGRRPILLIGLFGSSVSYVVFGLAETLAVLLISRILGGVMGANVPVAQAIIADSTSPAKRARGMGLIGAAFGLGFIFGPAIGGILSRWGYAAPGFAAAAIAGLNAIVAVFLLPESLPRDRRTDARAGWGALVDRLKASRRVLRRPELRRPIGVLFLITWGFAGFTVTFPLFLDEPLGLSAAHAGGLFAYVGLLSAIVQGRLIGPLVERHGEKRIATIGGLLLAAGFSSIAAFPSLWPLFGSLALVGLGWGCAIPSLQSVISRRARSGEQGEVLGVNQSSASAGRVIGPVAAGWGFGVLGPQIGFVAGGLLVALGAYLVWSMVDNTDSYFG
jgi:DHA1 family tetracycline resistance protein-like MFS transporter